MKVFDTTKELKLMKCTGTRKLHFSVEHPITHRRLYSATITVDEAKESIEYLREHNGNSPDFVKAFIDGMEIACGLVWYE